MPKSPEQDCLISLGWFRSGTTFLYRIFQLGLPTRKHIYEPLNPLIPSYFKEADGTDQFQGKRELFSYLEGREALINNRFEPAFGQHNFFLSPETCWKPMDDYLEHLVDGIPSVHLQFNRALGRVDYLRRLFPDSKVILVVRHPLAVWCSWHDYPVDPFNRDLSVMNTQNDQRQRELEHRLPEETLQYWQLPRGSDRPPLYSFLNLWGFLHHLVLQQIGAYAAYHVVRYEDLVSDWTQSLESIERALSLELECDQLPEPRSDFLARWTEHFPAAGESVWESPELSSAARMVVDRLNYLSGEEQPV